MSSAVIIPFPRKSSEANATMQRYETGYSFQRAASAFAESVALGGIALAGLLWMCALVAFQSIARERSAFPVVTVCFVAAAGWIVLVSQVASRALRIQVHLLQASLDSAVNGSPFLNNGQRGELMWLGRRPVLAGWECIRVRNRALLIQHTSPKNRPAAEWIWRQP